MKLRRLGMRDCADLEQFTKFMRSQRWLRHLNLQEFTIPNPLDMDRLFPEKLLRLRLLSLSNTCLSELPDSLGNLVHLRFLDLSENPSLRTIPDTVGKLRNLLTLALRGCTRLSRLPSGVVRLHNLRTLNLFDTAMDSMPAGFGRLLNLNMLLNFSCSTECSLEELRPLSQLRDLVVTNLERVSSDEARAAALVSKHTLRVITLAGGVCNPKRVEQLLSQGERERVTRIFEVLCPPPTVENLELNVYQGHKFPSWMSSDLSSITHHPVTLSNLKHLTLQGCVNCATLPALGLLPSLEGLVIQGALSVTRIGREFFLGDTRSETTTPFPKLRQLGFQVMLSLEEWEWDATPAMPNLQKLVIADCPRIVSLPKGLMRHATALKKLKLKSNQSLELAVHLRSLEKLQVIENHNLFMISDLPSLKSIKVINCYALTIMSGINDDLQSLQLYDDRMESPPSWLLLKTSRMFIQCSSEMMEKLEAGDDLDLCLKMSVILKLCPNSAISAIKT